MFPWFVYLGVFDPTFWFALPAIVAIVAYDAGWRRTWRRNHGQPSR